MVLDCSKKDDVVRTINVDKGINSTVDAILESDSGCLIPKGKSKTISTNIVLDDTISAPVSSGQKLGEVIYSIDNEEISRVNIVAKQEVKKLNLVNMSVRTIENWFTLLR